MRIQVPGTGCRTCNRTVEEIRWVGNELNIESEVDQVTDPMQLLHHQTLQTPAVIIDDKLAHSGSVPDRALIETWFRG